LDVCHWRAASEKCRAGTHLALAARQWHTDLIRFLNLNSSAALRRPAAVDQPPDAVAAFIKAACAPRDDSHASGALEEADAILAAHPEVGGHDIHTAAILGDEPAVRRFLALDPASATAKGGPYDWDALTHLCFSRYLKLDRARSAGLVGAATALLDAGADANGGWWEPDHQPEPEWESVLYGAAGIAKHAELTQLLLDRGGDPNDGETPYHAPEGYDNEALKVLVRSGKLNDDSLATMLLRKADWHDADGVAWLLDEGVDPNRMTHWGKTAFHQSVGRDNSIDIITAFLQHGADPMLPDANGRSAGAIAARRGRGDVLGLLAARRMEFKLAGVEQLLAACARGDQDAARTLAASQPQLVTELLSDGGQFLGRFAGVGNARGVELLVELGVPVDALDPHGDGYFEIAPRSTALHVAAWRARHNVVGLLIERGADVNARDGHGRTPLMLAVRACVDSYWTDRRSPESVAALLAAGASAAHVAVPTGYDDADKLLIARRDLQP
jgi:ankyrin repeat protein